MELRACTQKYDVKTPTSSIDIFSKPTVVIHVLVADQPKCGVSTDTGRSMRFM